MIPYDKLYHMIDRYEELENLMASGETGDDFVKISKEYSDLGPVVAKARDYIKLTESLSDLEQMMQDKELDHDMRAMAEEEFHDTKKMLPDLEKEMKLMLLPKDIADERNAILEIRAGTGGDEAAIFAGDLFRMYERYASSQGWALNLVSASPADMGGYKEIIAQVTGGGVFAKFKFESGVHRVQRVPVTETSGRIHTSAATVAVMPEAEDVDIDIKDDDLRIDVYRASGAGGQHVNKTESAVRITHIPTGVVVAMQEEKSQHKNKAKAMAILKTRIFDAERQKLADERSAERKGQVGSGDRSERIRTYNYPQGRVTDHRINLTLYNLPEIMEGTALHEVISALITEDQMAQLSSLEDGF
ncbi:MAG: peptide chain release factor 1 [Pseudomonadota bacterium]